MFPGRRLPEPLDHSIAAVTRRFWWPVYAEFRDNGYSPEASLDLQHEVVGPDPAGISKGLRHSRYEGRLRCWIEDRTREVLRGHTPSPSQIASVLVDTKEAEARDFLRRETRPQAGNPTPPFHQRWGIVVLETALDRLLLKNDDDMDGLELDDILSHLDRPLPSGPADNFPAWLQTPQIRSLKGQFWREVRRVINETIIDPRFLDAELLELFPPR